MSRLLINADDFGLHPLINEAVLRCLAERRVNSVSVMTNAGFVDYSVLEDVQKSGAFVGVHLAWVRSKWLTADYDIFGWKEFAWKLFSKGAAFQEHLKKEAEAQIRRMSERGIIPDHLDSHQHVHHFPKVWQITEELASRFGIKRVRCCKAAATATAKKGFSGVLLDMMAARCFNPDRHFYAAGLRFTGNYSIDRIASELQACVGRDTELIVHPAMETSELDRLLPDWKFDWKKEYEALMNHRLPEIIAQMGFCLAQRH